MKIPLNGQNRIALLLLILLLIVAASVLVHLFLPTGSWEAVPFHSTIEALGMVAALSMAALVLLLRQGKAGQPHYLWIASALIGMGILDGFHASVLPGKGFVWLHSAATLVGGVFFALVWLPDRLAGSRRAAALPWVVAIAAIIFGVLSVAFLPLFPLMIVHGQFTPDAKIINLLGGIFFLAAAARFGLRYQANETGDNLLFASLCLLFGSAGLLFPLSAIWQADWWLVHLFRLIAYAIALGYAFVILKQAEAALLRYRWAVESSPDLIAAIDRTYRYNFTNESFLRHRDFTREQVEGKTISEVLGDRLFQGVIKPQFDRCFNGEAVRFEFEDDYTVGRRVFEVSYLPLRDGKGSIEGVLALSRDITDRKRAEMELDRLFEVSPDMICIIGFDGCFKRLNPAWEKTLGHPLEDFLSKPFIEFVHPEDHEATNAEAAKLAQGARTLRFENRYRCKDGSYRWLSWAVIPAMEEKLLYCVARDVTERKLVEEELKKHREHLEELVKERTSQLGAANKELEAFSYSVSHDLRSPLRAIDGFSRILLEEYQGKLDDEGNRLLTVVRSNTKRMAQLIDDLLAFSRMSRKEMTRGRINMESLARSVFDDLKQTNGEPTIDVTIGQLPPAFGDMAMIRQVFENLLSNAFKFTRNADRAVVQIDGRIEGDENVYRVRDNGVGFDMEYKDKLFGIFQRLHGQEEFEGTGVGLAIVQRIIHRHGGRVWGEGAVNGGACFSFSLPGKSHEEKE